MRFLVDECIGVLLARWLRAQGHDVTSVFESMRGRDDTPILDVALTQDRILITADKDFGDLVYHEGLEHRGVILLRLEDESPDNQIARMGKLLARHADRLSGQFVVVTESRVRF